jgi:hypothetical protein
MTRFNTVGAHHHPFRATADIGFDPLKVGIEAALVDIVSMTYIIAHHRFFATYFACF